MKKIYNRNTFNCFSPLVMISTFIIEVLLLVYVITTRKFSQNTLIISLILTFLATFQLAEYGICENFLLSSNVWAKIGFSAITLLPVLGLHLVFNIADKIKQGRLLLFVSYIAALFWIFYFVFTNVMNGAICGGNYVIFHIIEPYELYYYLYYDSLLGAALILMFVYSHKLKNKQNKKALFYLGLGYLLFILPAVIIRLISNNSDTHQALPSILCGFALLFAFILVGKVLPYITKKK